MKPALISFAVGIAVGVLYGLISLKSPAPPLIALLGLLGMMIGKQSGGWILARNVTLAHSGSSALSMKPTIGSRRSTR